MKLDSAIFYTDSIEKSVAFYTNTIGLQLEYRGDRYASFLFENGVRLGVKKADEPREVVGAQTIIIEITEIETYFKECTEIDVNIYSKLEKEDWGTTFSILDPDGNRLEFLKRNR